MHVEEHLGTVTQKGQVTIPLAVRKLLGVRSRDRVTFRVIEGRVELTPANMTLEDVYGAVKPTHYPENWDKLRKTAREESVQRRSKKISRVVKDRR